MTRLLFMQRALLNERRSFALTLVWAALAVGAATAARFALAPWVEGVPFLTFFPAILLATLFLGWRWGIAVAFSSALAANFFFVEPTFSWALSEADVIGTLAFFVSAALLVATAGTLRLTVKEIDDNARREAKLNAELQHRVKNNLAVVQGLAQQTAKSVADPDEFYRAFLGRLSALAEAHNVLSSGRWEECRLPDLPQAAMRPFQEQGATILGGPACVVPPASCVPLVLALHELGTNALKYGALSTPTGQVALTWAVVEGRLVLHWQESGGPAVEHPTRKGLGSRLLAKQAGLDAVTVDYRREGLVCEITIKGARLI